jgi:hypothetical protein
MTMDFSIKIFLLKMPTMFFYFQKDWKFFGNQFLTKRNEIGFLKEFRIPNGSNKN